MFDFDWNVSGDIVDMVLHDVKCREYLDDVKGKARAEVDHATPLVRPPARRVNYLHHLARGRWPLFWVYMHIYISQGGLCRGGLTLALAPRMPEITEDV